MALEQWASDLWVTNRVSLYGNMMASEFGDCQVTSLSSVIFVGGGIWCGVVFRVGLGPLVQLKQILIFSITRDNFKLPAMWEQLGVAPSCSCSTVHQCTKSPDVNLTNTFGINWKYRLRSRLSANIIVRCCKWSKIPPNSLLNLVETLPRKTEAIIATKGGRTSH